MSVQEIEKAVTELTPDELTKFADWFAEYHWHAWDRQIEKDVKVGKLDALINQANDEFDAGQCLSLGDAANKNYGPNTSFYPPPTDPER